MFAAVLGSVVAIACFSIVLLTVQAWVTLQKPLSSALGELASTMGLHAVLLLAVWRRAAIVGDGDRSAGVGDGPIRQWWLIPLFLVVDLAATVGMILSAAAVSPNLLFRSPSRDTMSAALAAGPLVAALRLVLMVFVAPLAEELFFRGWLWTGLRRHWGPVRTGAVTGALWALAHIGAGVLKPLFLIPAVIFYSLVRHRCGSVRASIVVHILNNGVSAALTTAGYLLD